MKIHIVCSRLEADRILPRLAKSLAANAGYSISETPDDNADLTYLLIYLEYPKNGYYKTKTAALFSHLEENDLSKAQEWERVAKEVDIRTTWAKQYYEKLINYGVTFIVTPPLDSEKFSIAL